MSLIAHNEVEMGIRTYGALSDDGMDPAERAAWLAQRCGKLTASRMKDAMDFLKNGQPSAKRSAYMRDLLAERLTGLSMRHYVNPAMEWGLQFEAEAKEMYTRLTGNVITPTGFTEHPLIDNFGATPDGIIVGKKRLLEVKCPTTTTFIEWTLAGMVPEEHKPQMLAQIACSGISECDFFAYEPRLKDEKKRCFLRTYTPHDSEITRVEHAATNFLNELDSLFDEFVSS